MKKFCLAIALAAVVAPASFSHEGDHSGAALGTPSTVGHAVAADTAAPLLNGPSHAPIVGGCNDCCDPCGRCFWAYGEYLYWRTKEDQTPPLLTATTTVPRGPAVVQTFRGPGDDDYRYGYRIGMGFYPNCKCKNLGVEANWFSLKEENEENRFTTAPTRQLTRPFNNVVDPQANALLIGGGTTGATGFAAFTQANEFEGGNAGFRWKLGSNRRDCTCVSCFELLAGYQYYQLDDSLDIRTRQAFGALQPVVILSRETFETENQYHGGYLGFAGEVNCGKWFVGGAFRGGAGYLRESTRIAGTTTSTIGNAQTFTAPFGTLLARPSNIGDREEDEFTWSGEAGVRIGYQPNCWLRLYTGYNYIYIDEVVRSGDLVNTNVNLGQVNGRVNPALPNYNPQRDSFWAQGFTGGVEIKF